jgi:nucleotide-binding universal stress UspA family protein
MSPIRSILLHLDASDACAKRLQVALQLADQHAAAVTALYAVTPALLQNPTALAIAASPEIAPLLAEYDHERRTRARALFDKAASGRDRIHWQEAQDEPTRAFTRAAFYSDLLVLGQREPRQAHNTDLPPDFVESVVLWSGKPALVLPHIGPRNTLGKVVLVAWKESRESARALAAALPLLQRAEQVHLALWNDGADAAQEPARRTPPTPLPTLTALRGPDDSDLPDVLSYLRRHGVAATLHQQAARSAEVGGLLLSLAADLSADLLVMGCYGHGRAREWVMGGVTRTVLAAMTVPVLMVH